MDTPSSAGLPRRWREAKPVARVADAPLAKAKARGPLVCLGLLAMVVILAAIGGMLSWLGPVPSPYFLPVMITTYQNRAIPSLPMVQRDLESLCANAYFRSPPRLAYTDGHAVMQDLAGLTKLDAKETAVVYVSAHAVRGSAGKIHLLPGDADPDNPETWISLRTLLEKLRACPAHGQLLVLDIMKPARLPRLGDLYADIAGALAAELDAVPDPRRLVLSACAPGQVALVSEELGRSVFSYYFEEALHGYAEGYSAEGRYDKQITVRELAAFVRARVDRWAIKNRAARQTPVLHGTGADFALVALDHGQPREHLLLAQPKEYPDYLLEAWQMRDSWWSDGTYQFEPRVFQQVQAGLQEAEQAWRGGVADAGFNQSQGPALQKAQTQIMRQRTLFQPRAVSLGQEQFTNPQPEESVTQPLRILMDNLQNQLADTKVEEAEKVKATLRAEFQYRVKDQTNYALEAAVFAWAVADTKHEPGTLRFLDDVLRRRAQPEPHYVETLLLRQLADLAYRVEGKDWPAPLVGCMLRLAQLGEKAGADQATFPWTARLLEEAAQARHRAEVCLWARGYASLTDAERFAQTAEDKYKSVLAQAGLVRHAQSTLEEALALLPIYLPYLEANAGQQTHWDEAASAARDLAEALAGPPAWKKGKTSASSLVAQEKIAEVQDLAQRLAGQLEELKKPFAKENISALTSMSRQQGAGPGLVANVEALLSVPIPSVNASDRATLWGLARAVARTLNEETMRLDHDEDLHKLVTVAPEPIPGHDPVQEAITQARRRAQTMLALFDLGGLSAERMQPALDCLTRLTADNAAAGDWSALDDKLRQLWGEQLSLQYQEETAAARRVRLGWIAPPLERFSSMDDAKLSAAALVRLRQARDHWSWLGDHYRYQARDYQGLGLAGAGPSAAHAFYAQAALANEDIARREPEVYATLQSARPIDTLASQQVPVRAVLEISRVMPPGRFGPLDVSLVLQDNAWLRINPASLHLPGVSEAAEPRRLVTRLPVLIEQKPGAERSFVPRPAGFLAQAHFEGRVYHTLVDVPLQTQLKEVQILVSTDSVLPQPAVSAVRLRPNKSGQPFYVYLQNLTERTRKVTLEGQVGDGPKYKVQVKLNPEETQRVRFGEAPIPKEGLPETAGALVLRATDTETTNLLDQKQLRVEVLSLTLHPEVRPALHWRIAPFVKAAAKISFPIEVDNAPAGSHLEVSLGRGTPDRFEAERVSRFPQAKQQRIGFWAQGQGGALIFDASVSDWPIAWSTGYIVGQRILRARLLDAQDKEITRATQFVSIDGDPPSVARLVDVPPTLRRGSALTLRAHGNDPESGIAQVVFFVGRPRDNSIPPNTLAIAATPLDAGKTTWTGAIQLPKDKTGVTAVTAQFTNGVGLVCYHTATLEVTDFDPANGPGQIRGKVLEGPRAQPALDVVLRDLKGVEKRRTKTQADGTFFFESVPPGSYVIFCVKPESGRRATVPALVQPNETTVRDVVLSL